MLKNKRKELFELEIRLKEGISQLNETNQQYQRKINIVNQKNKIDQDIHNKEVHIVHSEVEKLRSVLKAAEEEYESLKTRLKSEHEVIFSLKAKVSDLRLVQAQLS